MAARGHSYASVELAIQWIAAGRFPLDLLTTHQHYLQSISCGAVFMGANTYIGNAPNFMVKSIAEHAGIQMPGFFGYILKFTIPVMIPLLLLVTFLFFR